MSLSSHTLSYIHLNTLVLCTCLSVNSLKDVAISAVCQRDQMQQLSDWEGFIVSVIKVARNRREIHLRGNKVSGEHFCLVWREHVWSQNRNKLFSWMLANAGSRHAGEPQVMSVTLIQLVCLMQGSLFTLAVCRINRSSLRPSLPLLKVCYLFSFF